ncbi:MAG: AI-2E family transporter [Chitinophagales bacterium]|nr:AI-2E family transporter [Chitinophagales bacterium]
MIQFKDKLRLVSFLVVITGLAVLLFFQLEMTITGFLGAVTLYILNKSWLDFFTRKKKWNKFVVIALLMFFDALVLLIPLGLISYVLGPRLIDLYENNDIYLTGLKEIAYKIYSRTGLNFLSKDNLEKIPALVSSFIPDLLGSASNLVTNIGIMFLILYYMLKSSDNMSKAISNLLPLSQDNIDKIGYNTKSIVKSYAIGIPVLAFSQGFVATIGYYIFKIDDPILWGFLTGVCSIIPVVGSALIVVPLVTYLFVGGDTGAAIGLALYAVFLIMNIDNLLRMFLLEAFADIHPLITLFGVIVGVQLFGFLGLIFGPLLISYFILLVKIFISEFNGKPSST